MDITPDPHQTDTAPERESSRPKGLPRVVQLLILLAAAGVVAVLLLGRAALHLTASSPAPGAAPAAADDSSFKPTPAQWANLKIAPVALTTFQEAEETDGKIALDDDLITPVFTPYSGRVTKLFARAGDSVQAGAPLAAVQASEFVQGQNDLVTAVSALNTARAQLRLSQTNERRQHDLFTANAGAQRDWQQSQLDLATAQGGLSSAEIALGAVRNRLRILGKSDREISDLENAPTQRFSPDATLVAPISGTVTQRQVGLGQYIVNQSNGSSTPIFSIGDLSRVWLVANVRETDAPLVHLGDAVEVGVLAFPGRIFKARIVYVASAIDPNTHRLPVRAELANQDGALKPEMFATFRIISGTASEAPAVPDSAVVYEGAQAHVFVADDTAHTVAIRPVGIGRSSSGMDEITSGLKAGEKIVTSGSVFIDRALQGD